MYSSGGNKITGVFAILTGVSYIIIGITFFLLPEDQRPGAGTHNFLLSIAEESTLSILIYWALAVGSVLAIAVVFAVADLVGPTNKVLVRWSTTLAIIGLAVVAVQFLVFQDQVPRMARDFNRLDQEMEGIGLVFLSNRAGDVTVHPYPRQPAPQGVGDGDFVVAVNGMPVAASMSPGDVAGLTSASGASSVTLTLRTGDSEPHDVTIARGKHRFLELSTRDAIRIIGPIDLDPDRWMGFGTVGLWFLVVNWLAIRGRRLPRVLSYVGLGVGIAFLLTVGGSALDQEVLIAIAAGLGATILSPIWWIWTGVFFWRAEVQES